MSKTKVKKKLLYAALAALAGGGVLYAVYRNREEDEELEGGGTKSVPVLPPTGVGGGLQGGSAPPLTDETATETPVDTEEEIIGGGGGGGAGFGAGLRMCLGLNDEAERDVKYVAEGEECPSEFPFDTEEQVEEAQYDAFRCYDVDDNDEIVEQEKELDEVCGEDYPDFPFETRNEALLYLETPSEYEGCTDPEALNFNVDVIFDDGSCELPVEGCMLEDALNFDPEANVEANDLCEFAPEEVLGCTSETANNFDVEATADDGSCIFSKSCYIFNSDYSIRTEEFEFFSADATCYDDIPEVLGEVGGVLVFRLGYFDAEEDAEAYLDGFYNGAVTIGGGETPEMTDCFFYIPDTGVVSSQPTELAEGESCPDASIGSLEFFDSQAEAEQAYFDDVLSLQTQSCISFDSQGTFILDDLPYVSDDTQDIISCEDLDYFELTEDGEANAQAEYLEEFGYPDGFADAEAILTTIEQCAGFNAGMIPALLPMTNAIPDIPNTIAISDANAILGYECFDPVTGEVIDTDGPDTSPLLTTEQINSANLCDGFSIEVNNEFLTQFGSTLTAKVANELLGSDCFDLVTGENGNVEPVSEGSVMDATEGIQVGNLCYDNSIPDAIFGAIAQSQFPLSPQEFNVVMDFECLDASGEIVNQITAQEEEVVNDESVVVDAFEEDGVGGLLDSLSDFDTGTTEEETLPTENLEEQVFDNQSDLLSEEVEVVGNEGDVTDAFEEEGVGGLVDSLVDYESGTTEEEVIPTGFIADTNEAVALAQVCFGQSPQVGITLNLNTKQYPISPEEFNTTIGFTCLNSDGDVVGEPPTEEEQVVVDAYEQDGVGGLLESLTDFDSGETQEEILPTEEPQEEVVVDAFEEDGVGGALDELTNFDTTDSQQEAVMPQGFIADGQEAIELAQVCFNGSAQVDVILNLNTKQYPISPEEFNASIGFSCLNIDGDVVAQAPTEQEQVVVDAFEEDGVGGLLESLTDFDTGTTEEEILPTEEPQVEFEAEIDNSPLLTTAQFQTLQECGQVLSSALTQANTEFGDTLTADRANELLGYECFDLVTGENLFYEPIPEEFIEDGNEAANLVVSCFNGTPPINVITQIPLASYPLSPENFNAMLGFDCLNSNGDIVGEPPAPIDSESQTSLEEQALVDNASIPVTPEPVLPDDDPDRNVDDALETGGSQEIQKNFNDFVNSSGRSSNVGCTDALAWNFNEFAVKDDGTCEY